MKEKKGSATASNDKVDFDIAIRNLFPLEIFEHKQLQVPIPRLFLNTTAKNKGHPFPGSLFCLD